MFSQSKAIGAMSLFAVTAVLLACEGPGSEGGAGSFFEDESVGTTTIAVTIKFSDFGKPVNIEAPEVRPTPQSARVEAARAFEAVVEAPVLEEATAARVLGNSERVTIQTAMNAMMADNSLRYVPANGASTNSWSDNPSGDGIVALYPHYLRFATTTYFYCWDFSGNITTQSESSDSRVCPPAAMPAPTTPVARAAPAMPAPTAPVSRAAPAMPAPTAPVARAAPAMPAPTAPVARAAPIPTRIPTRAPTRVANPTPFPTPTPTALPFRDFEITLYQGEDEVGGALLRYSDLLKIGKPIVLNFWAGKLPPSRIELPHLERLHREFGDRITVLAVDLGGLMNLGTEVDAVELLQELEFIAPAGRVSDESILRLFEIVALPTTLFIRPDGSILAKWSGVANFDVLAASTKELLVGYSGPDYVEIVSISPGPTTHLPVSQIVEFDVVVRYGLGSADQTFLQMYLEEFTHVDDICTVGVHRTNGATRTFINRGENALSFAVTWPGGTGPGYVVPGFNFWDEQGAKISSFGLDREYCYPFGLESTATGQTGTATATKVRPGTSVLIDSSRDGGVWWFPQAGPFDPNAPHQGKAVADYLRSTGYAVTELPRPFEITTELLEQYSVVVRAGEFGSYTDSELDAYRAYVSSGGKLLLLHDSDHFDLLGPVFGLEFAGTTRGNMTVALAEPHPVTEGVPPFTYGVGSGLILVPASALILGHMAEGGFLDLNDNGALDEGEPPSPPVMGLMSFGQGRIVFAGDTNFLLWVPQPLTANILAWLTGQPTPTPTPATASPTPKPLPLKEWRLERIQVDGSAVTVLLQVFAGIDVRATLDGKVPDQTKPPPPYLEFVFRNVEAGEHAIELKDVVGFSETAVVTVYAASPTPTPAPAPIQPLSGLVSWWPGDGTAEDIVGGNHGTLLNGATFAPGVVGQAISFDGLDDYVEIGDISDFEITSATAS